MTIILPLYILLFLFLFHFPALFRGKDQEPMASLGRKSVFVLQALAAIATLTFLLRSDNKWIVLLICNFAIATIFFNKSNWFDKKLLPLGGLFALGFTFIAVQNPALSDISTEALMMFTVLFVAALNIKNTSTTEIYNRIAFVTIAACLFFSAMQYDEIKANVTALFISSHHWSFYLSPVFAFKDGAVPYRDFPMQYGIGPTALLAYFCKTDCWHTMSIVVPALNIATFALFSLSILKLSHGHGRDIRYLALFALLSASIFWIGNPAAYYGPFGTPSVNGMRFIFLAIAIFCVLSFDFRIRNHIFAIIPIWILGSIWSMESFFFVSAIFTCTIIFDRAAPELPKVRSLKSAYIISTLALISALAIFFFARYLYELFYLEPLNLRNVFISFIYLPGPLPADWFGMILLIGIIITLGITSILKLDRQSARNIYIATLGLAAGLSYYLSRSHDNNIVNIYPLLIILITALYTKLTQIHVKAALVFWLAGVVAGPSLFYIDMTHNLAFDMNSHALYPFLIILFGMIVIGWQTATASTQRLSVSVKKMGLAISFAGLFASAGAFILNKWEYGLFVNAGDLSIAHRKELYSTLLEFPKKAEKLTNYDDLLALYNEIKARADTTTSPVLVNSDYYLAFQDLGGSWTSINNFSNIIPIPDPISSEFIISGARQFQKSGWIIIEKSMEERWLPVFLSGYQVDAEIVRGDLTAYLIKPR